mgnify:CR=1 FL=1
MKGLLWCMARNKYPEVTLEKILEVSQQLFFEKGFDQTTIQDIVDRLEGLTRGAVYHHFTSKEDIMHALIDRMFLDNNPFVMLQNRTDLNGLQKMRLAITMNQRDEERVPLSIQAIPILQNPRILAGMMESNRKNLSPLWLKFINEGIADGSIQTSYAKELSELIPLLELWLMPSIYPASAEEMIRKFEFMRDMLDKMGLPLFEEETVEQIKMMLRSMND